jgi:exoribonuclease-2
MTRIEVYFYLFQTVVLAIRLTLPMPVVMVAGMETGNIVEYIDRQKILCAVVLEVKQNRLRLLTENNREVNLSANRLLHRGNTRLDINQSRDKLVESLKATASRRLALIQSVDIKDLWQVLNTEQEWIDLHTMTAFCFPDSPSADHESAVIRAIFDDRLYFKFNPDRFFPHSEDQVQRMALQRRETARRERIVTAGGNWLKRIAEGHSAADGEQVEESEAAEFKQILRSYYLFGKEFREHPLAKEMTKRAGVHPDRLFELLVRAGCFDEDENLDLPRLEVPCDFSAALQQAADRVVAQPPAFETDARRLDLTHLDLITIDGQSTLDFDDALSIEKEGGRLRAGIHIVDVAHFIRGGDSIDAEALARGSSIYMPDRKISMLPAVLAEGLCSLKKGELRPAISILVDLSPEYRFVDYRIAPSLVRVRHQLSYFDVNAGTEDLEEISILSRIAAQFRQQRLEEGAVQITLPEINIWVGEDRGIHVNKVQRESPGRLLVSELMILANWLMAKFLTANGLPAIFRSQAAPRERLYSGGEGTLFQNWMQRRLISRFMLGTRAEKHSGLGLEAYITATSPIRKYFDLVGQRQIRAALGLTAPYSEEDINHIIQQLEIPMSHVSRLQYGRHRYWLLKYLEKCIGQKEEALVLTRRKRNFQILLTAYMLECDLPFTSGLELKPEDLIQVTIQRVSARKDVLDVSIG